MRREKGRIVTERLQPMQVQNSVGTSHRRTVQRQAQIRFHALRDADCCPRWISCRRDDGRPSAKLKPSGGGVEQGCACRSPLIGDRVIARDWKALTGAKCFK